MRLITSIIVALLPLQAWAETNCAREVADVWALIASIEETREKQEGIALDAADQDLYNSLKALGPDASIQWRKHAAILEKHCFTPDEN